MGVPNDLLKIDGATFDDNGLRQYLNSLDSDMQELKTENVELRKRIETMESQRSSN